jgi:hypothetical protein
MSGVIGERFEDFVFVQKREIPNAVRDPKANLIVTSSKGENSFRAFFARAKERPQIRTAKMRSIIAGFYMIFLQLPKGINLDNSFRHNKGEKKHA